MTEDRYPAEVLADEYDDTYENQLDNGTMPDNVDELRQAVVGRRIVKAEERPANIDSENYWERYGSSFVLTLDDGTEVRLHDTDDCCAYTTLKKFFLHPDKVDHMILGVGTTEQYTRWHIYADLGDVMELEVGWSAGNPFYYGYGFHIDVVPV